MAIIGFGAAGVFGGAGFGEGFCASTDTPANGDTQNPRLAMKITQALGNARRLIDATTTS
jgi:hypothetical protein